jgi:16S rRNA (guanine527-N7)-methyltransferase
MTPKAALERGLTEMGLALPAGVCEQLLEYTTLLEKWNRTYNLTAVRDPLAMVSHHLLDSLAVLPHLAFAQAGARFADVGSGAGLPGIPLALARPDWRVALIESNEKKAAFLQQAKIGLRLSNVEIHARRVETWQPIERFAVVISRAFAELADFVAACKHLLMPRGVVAAMKGKDPRDEIARLPSGVRCRDVLPLKVPFVDGERHLVLCELS